MDVYTTSFCLPHRASTRDLEDPASSFELPRDVAAAAAAQNNPGAHPITTHHTNGHRSNPSSARPASIPERVEEGDPEPPESSPSGSNGTVVPLSSGLTARRSTSSIASLGHSVTSASSAGGNTVDAASTAPSSAAASVTGAPIASSSGSGSTAGGKRGVDGADGTQRIVFETGEQLQRLCKEAMSNYQCMVTCSPLEAGKGYNFHLSGGYQQVMGARGYILRGSPFKQKAVVKVPRSEVLDAKENVKTEMRRKLDEIAALTKAHLAIVGQVSGTIGFGLETERNVEIVITGSYESVEQGRVRLLVLLDELSGLHSDVCEIDYKLHNIISGRKRCVIQTIQEETATNVYFPTPLSGVMGVRDPTLLSKQNLIFITGEFFGVQRARDMLFQVSLHKSKCIISRDTAMLPRKLDWLISDRLEDVKQIMHDNGTFINFPMIGSQASLLSVYGDHRVNIERTIRSIMLSFWLLPMNFDVFMPPPTINPSQVPAILKLIAAATGAEAVFKSNCFEFHGLEAEVRTAVQLVLELDIVKAFHHEIRFQIELANEHRDFISGKKNGKLNKIMKTAGVKIKFETFNDYNFLIDTAGNDTGALHGLTMLQEELPAEISFHVPEIYHKRIIGVGGKNIQRIMKKYGVYVKFSNAEEFASLGGYLDNEDNVVARTPFKNASSLDHLKQAVMEMVIPKDKDFVVETVSIPRRYHRTLLGEKSIFIHDIESKTNSIVRFPNKESALDYVSIFGPESQVHIAAQMLLDHVPFEAEYRLPHSEQMSQLALSQEFLELQYRLKRDLNITILPWVDRSGNGEETSIRFLLNRSNQHFLTTSRDTVEEFLLSKNIPLYPGSLRPRSDSFATSFPFFNSKLLSTLENESPSPSESTENKDKKPLRPTASTPDIKAIFDGPPIPSAYNYFPPEPLTGKGTPVSFYQPHLSPTAITSPGVTEFQPLTTPRFHAPQPPSSPFPPPFVPSHPTRVSEEMAVPALKREGDPIMEDKLKDLVRRGAMGHHLNARAQSLDISRQSEAFGRGTPSEGHENLGSTLSQLRL
ncbi:MAG: hypothetical protein CYPHOPRED_001779 [Cyphobasidiales sp. Tagirdzhanova-0007]|nr:MAG: hypothetical protein CYPHOPRED_001779 [Cyphobasidiales sp. Tagirdzhanova-0007]